MKRWKFGRQQRWEEEWREMRDAQAQGRAETYIRGQRYADLIEAELQRRRTVKAERRRAA